MVLAKLYGGPKVVTPYAKQFSCVILNPHLYAEIGAQTSFYRKGGSERLSSIPQATQPASNS